jgi:exostosin family protein
MAKWQPMKVHVAAINEADQPWVPMLHARAAYSRLHEIEPDPSQADLILLPGIFALEPRKLLEHAVYRAFPDRCAVYTEEDTYLPLIPGVYCSARIDESTRIGRVFSYTYLSRNGRHLNPFLAEIPASTPITAPPVKRYLFSFQGGSTSLVRKRLFNLKFDRDEILVENTSAFHNWDNSQPDRLQRQLRYAETVAASHFVLCPRGAGTGSIRFFEVMAAGVAPVLVSDDYELPCGPGWDRFLIRVREKDIAKLPQILETQLPTAQERGRLACEAFFAHFSVQHEFDQIVERAALAIKHVGPPETEFRRRQPAMIRRAEWKRKSWSAVRAAVLQTLKALRLRNPYQMNR